MLVKWCVAMQLAADSTRNSMGMVRHTLGRSLVWMGQYENRTFRERQLFFVSARKVGDQKISRSDPRSSPFYQN